MEILFYILVATWVTVGYLSWRVVYYASIKDWYLQFGDDYRQYNNGNNAMRLWKFSMPVVIVGGLISLWCTLGDSSYKKHGAVLYFKVPKHTPARDHMATINNN